MIFNKLKLSFNSCSFITLLVHFDIELGSVVITLTHEEEFVLGYAKVSLRGNKLTLKDPYRFEEYTLLDEAQVKIKPVLLNKSPSDLTQCLAMSFKTPLIVSTSSTIRIEAPYELEVLINNRPVSVLTPFKVKYTVLGTPAEGILCRWFPSELVDKNSTTNATLEIRVETKETVLIKDVLIEDVTDLPIKVGNAEKGFHITYGPIQGSIINNHLVISKKKFQSKIVEVVKTEPQIPPWLTKQP